MSICETCTSGKWCETWGEMKCMNKKMRIYGYKTLTDPAQCTLYKKRGADFKESKCQCDECLENEKLYETSGED